MRTMEYITAEILTNKNIAPEIFSMTLKTPAIQPKPGQFAMLYLSNLLLPRPISICDFDNETVTLVYQTVGVGTKIMSELKPTETIKLLAPLGNGFYLPTPEVPYKNPALVGGGIGTPPLLYLAKTLAASGIKPDIYLGFRSHPILTEEFKPFANKIHISTDDGSQGHHGKITDILKNDYDQIMACGPSPLLKALKPFNQGTKIQLSLEERMGCGIGTCVGCVVKAGENYVRICCEGPVFYSNEVDMYA